MMTQDDCLNKGTRDTTSIDYSTRYKTLNQGEPRYKNGFILCMLGTFHAYCRLLIKTLLVFFIQPSWSFIVNSLGPDCSVGSGKQIVKGVV